MTTGIRAIVFDLGGTLVSHETETDAYKNVRSGMLGVLYTRLCANTNLSIDFSHFESLYASEGHRLLMDAIDQRGTMNEADIFKEIYRKIGDKISKTEAESCGRLMALGQTSLPVLYPDASAALSKLAKLGVAMGLISNTPWPGEAHDDELKRHGIYEFFRFRLYSSDAGHWKPGKAIFEKGIAQLGMPPSEIAYVGDRLVDDVGGSQAAGLKGILIDRTKTPVAKRENISPDWAFSDLTQLLKLPFH